MTKRFTIICGVSEYGKTSFALRYLLNDPGIRYRFIFDCTATPHEFAQRLKMEPAVGVAQMDEHARFGWVCFSPHVLFPAAQFCRDGRHLVAFRFFCQWVMQQAKTLPGRKALVVDEVWKYCDPHRIPPEFASVLQEGRHHGLEGIFLTQRPNHMNESIHNEATEVVSFRIQGRNALRTLEETHHFNPDEISRLAPGHYVSRNSQGGAELRGNVFA